VSIRDQKVIKKWNTKKAKFIIRIVI
jgi:hypothetical protein